MNVKIGGRHVLKDGVLYLSFSGSFIEFVFEGKHVSAEIKTDKANDPNLVGFAGVFVNGEFKSKLKLDRDRAEYVLFESDKSEKVTVRLMRFSENNFGKLGIIDLKSDGEISPTSDKDNRIEFIGDSITCGYGVEAASENETFCTETENPAEAYAVMTAEAIDADFNLISWSGNGLLTQWIPPERDVPDVSVPLMPDIYKWTDFGGYAFEGFDKPQDYDFCDFEPQLVVINLGTNDASYTRGIPERVKAFGEAYCALLDLVREKRPTAKIICCLGIMNNELCNEVERQVKLRNKKDKEVYFLRQELIGNGETYGADWHPGKQAQKRIADQLTGFIESIV